MIPVKITIITVKVKLGGTGEALLVDLIRDCHDKINGFISVSTHCATYIRLVFLWVCQHKCVCMCVCLCVYFFLLSLYAAGGRNKYNVEAEQLKVNTYAGTV